MAGLSTIQSFWGIITEIDLRPLAREALDEVKISLVGSSEATRGLLAEHMRRDPSRPDMETDAPILTLGLDQGLESRQSDLVILILDGDNPGFGAEKALARQLADLGKRVLVFVRLDQTPATAQTLVPALPWKPRYVVYGSVEDGNFLHNKFAPAVIRLLADKVLALGRNYPLFRVPIARYLIADTAQSNAAYSLATGLAELVPILNIPLVVTDMIILTKNQAFLAYKLGLSFGFSTEWKNYAGEFGGVLGLGFLWRQFARLLVGLIPGFGIIPKVGVSYAGTVVVGNAVLQWYLTGRHVSTKQIQSWYGQAYLKGKTVVARYLPRLPRRKPKALQTNQTEALPAPKPKVKIPRSKKHVCPQCGRASAKDASFCQYCGHSFIFAQTTSKSE